MGRTDARRAPTGAIGPRPLAHAAWLTAAASRHVVDALSADGTALRFVGGCVRDTLLDPTLDMVDLDLVTPLPPERTMERLRSAGIRGLPTGLAHGTVTALVAGRSFEITTLRRDVATDGRRAQVAFTDSFVADAARRDFTINAMSCDMTGRLFDPFGGRRDLAAGRIRFVGAPVLRIREDYLRILRFFRFYARLGREPPSTSVLAALAAERPGLDRLSGERLRAELLKLLVAPKAEASLELMRRTGVWRQIFGAEPALDLFRGLLRAAPAAGPILRLAALLRGAASAEHAALRLRLSNDERARLLALVAAELPPLDGGAAALRRMVYRLGAERAADRLRLAAAAAGAPRTALAPLLAIVEDFEVPSLPVTGHDLIARGVAPGPELGRRLAAIEAAWLASDFTADKDGLLAGLARAGNAEAREEGG